MPGRGDRGTEKQKPRDAKGALRRLAKYLLEYGWAILGLAACSLLANLGNLLGPRFAGRAISYVEAGWRLGPGHIDMAAVRRCALIMLVFYVCGNIMSFMVTFGMTRVGRRIARNLRRDVFDKLMRLPVGYFDRNQTGDIISRVSYDIEVVCTSLSTDLIQIMTSAVTVAGSFIMMCTISLPLVACMVFTIPVSVLFTRRMSRRTRPLYAKRSRAYGAMNGFAEEMFTGQRTILAYAREEEICRRFGEINRAAAEAYRNADGLGMTMGPTIGMISNCGLSAIGMGGAALYLKGLVGLGQISSFVLYSRKFSGPINEFSNILSEIFSALAASERIFALLDQPEEPADAPDAAPLLDCRGDVRLEDVTFGYVPGKTVLRDVSLSAPPGRTIAIVGPTGAGKTSIINLLMRFYDPESGRILVDGREHREYAMASLRRAYAMVLQDTWLFGGTIFENIAYGKEDAAREEVEAAARAARIHSAVMRLPKGYDTVITEDGGNISKGQKQLLTIARAMLYDTNMLILDEATSNVDTATERQVQKAIRSLMRGRTAFVIAHRLSTVQNADRILVVRSGRIVEQGTHDDLMAMKGEYYRLYASQFE